MNKKIQNIAKLAIEFLEYVEENDKKTAHQIDLDLLMDSFIMLEEAHSLLERRNDP